jgi:hypothetical protein
MSLSQSVPFNRRRTGALLVAGLLAIAGCDSSTAPYESPDPAPPGPETYAIADADGVLLLTWTSLDLTHEFRIASDTIILAPDGTGRRAVRAEERIIESGATTVTTVDLRFRYQREPSRIVARWTQACDGPCTSEPDTTVYHVDGTALRQDLTSTIALRYARTGPSALRAPRY